MGRAILAAAGFQYDSSVAEPPTGSLSRGQGDRAWPYSLASGFPDGLACGWLSTSKCEPGTGGERYPLMEVPVWVLGQSPKWYR